MLTTLMNFHTEAGSGDKDPITEASPVRGAEVIGAFYQGICL